MIWFCGTLRLLNCDCASYTSLLIQFVASFFLSIYPCRASKGYLSNGQIFDGTHGEGKNNLLTFRLGEDVIVEGLTEMLGYMGQGQKVQVIVPPKLAFGDKGLCLENGECLIKPGQTLVYDLYLKKTAVPPP